MSSPNIDIASSCLTKPKHSTENTVETSIVCASSVLKRQEKVKLFHFLKNYSIVACIEGPNYLMERQASDRA